MSVRKQSRTRALPPTLTLLALLIIWELAARLGGVSEQVLPAPSRILVATVQSREDLLPATAITALEGLLGFLLASVLGIVVGLPSIAGEPCTMPSTH